MQEVEWCAGDLDEEECEDSFFSPGYGPEALAGWSDVQAEGGWDRLTSS